MKLKKVKISGHKYRKLGEILSEKYINEVFKGLYDNMDFYFQLVLTNKLGLNLRNNLAHGISKNIFFTRNVSDRLFHILLCLSLIRKK